MATTIVFSSQKGGVGKTTSAVNLATAFAIGGYRVLVVDMDPQGSVRHSFGHKQPVAIGTRQLLAEPSVPLDEIMVSADSQGIDIVFSNIETLGQEQELGRMIQGPEALKKRLDAEGGEYDFVILDAPASTGILTMNALVAADLVILPLQCESLAVKSLKRFLMSFREVQRMYSPNLRIAGVLLTMFDRDVPVHRKVCRQLYDTLTDSVFSTIIPKSKDITEASALGQSVITYNVSSIGATAYIRLAKEILDRYAPQA